MKTRTGIGLIGAGLLSLAGITILNRHFDSEYTEAIRPVIEYTERGLAVPHNIAEEAYTNQQKIMKIQNGAEAGGISIYAALIGLGAGELLANRREKKR